MNIAKVRVKGGSGGIKQFIFDIVFCTTEFLFSIRQNEDLSLLTI